MTEVMEVVDRYCDLAQISLHSRWAQIDLDLYQSEPFEVIGGLLARQVSLSVHLGIAPTSWTPHLAPIVLRSMVDAQISLAWILLEPEERAKKYVLHGLGQEKLAIEHLRASLEESKDLSSGVEEQIRFKEAWLSMQRHDFLTEVNLGSWSGVSTRQMAMEAGCEDLYKFPYSGFSVVAHNMWPHISVFNLRHCENPLHKYHRVPVVAEVELDIDYLVRSSLYLSDSLRLVDDHFSLDAEVEYPDVWLEAELKRMSEEG